MNHNAFHEALGTFTNYCRFAGRFSKTAVRATGAVSQSGDSTIAIVEAR